MKLATAMCFALTGIILIVNSRRRSSRRDILLALASILVITIMFIMLWWNIGQQGFGIFEFLLIDNRDSPSSSSPGVPSIATMFGFILVGGFGILSLMLPPERVHSVRTAVGLVVTTLGAVPCIGYLFGPDQILILEWEVPGVSSAMAIHTAMAFLLTGWVLMRQPDPAPPHYANGL